MMFVSYFFGEHFVANNVRFKTFFFLDNKNVGDKKCFQLQCKLSALNSIQFQQFFHLFISISLCGNTDLRLHRLASPNFNAYSSEFVTGHHKMALSVQTGFQKSEV